MTEQQQTTNPTPTAPEATGGESNEQEPFDAERAMEKIRKTNSENAGLRKRLKELEQFETAAKAAEDAKKSETQRFTEQLADANRRAEEAELGRLRERVARRAQLPDELADRLRGNTEEELTADAKALAALTANAQASGREERRRTPDPSQGQGMALNGDPLEDSLRAALGI
ncbi:hypothetical protein [Pseudonocardia sp. N23]|uniref:hypothetical protein n=1 Tax=Pseudonocardia sp. N23 TaxID=1987376 RepID=UPI000BFE5413|nr:hypothetical protein [Pseudonocardia sp. N23]GAY12042.1 methyl-accepting chemotaxis protein [Pseudonocardia sp. N23]